VTYVVVTCVDGDLGQTESWPVCPAYKIILEIRISVPVLSCAIVGTGVRGGVMHVFWVFSGGSAILPSLWTSAAGINFTSALVPSKLPWNEQVLERRVDFICRHWFSNYPRFMNIHPDAVDVGFTTASYCWLCFIHLCLSASVSFRYRSRYFLAYIVCDSAGCVTGDFETTNIYKHSARPGADSTTRAGQQGIHLIDSMKWCLWKASQEVCHTSW